MHGSKILVVEDHPMSRKMLIAMLRQKVTRWCRLLRAARGFHLRTRKSRIWCYSTWKCPTWTVFKRLRRSKRCDRRRCARYLPDRQDRL